MEKVMNKDGLKDNLAGLTIEQPTGKLAVLFEEIGSLASIDEAALQAKNQLMKKQKRVDELEELFEIQMRTLSDRRCPEFIVGLLRCQKSSVLKRASGMLCGRRNIPFIPIVPLTFRSVYDLMGMVRYGIEVDYGGLNPIVVANVVEIPSMPYYIFDVEDGEVFRGRSPQYTEKIFRMQSISSSSALFNPNNNGAEAMETVTGEGLEYTNTVFKKKWRSPLIAAEVIALCVHTDVLSWHAVCATGSHCSISEMVPFVYINKDRLGIDWQRVDDYDSDRGSASCGSRHVGQASFK